MAPSTRPHSSAGSVRRVAVWSTDELTRVTPRQRRAEEVDVVRRTCHARRR